ASSRRVARFASPAFRDASVTARITGPSCAWCLPCQPLRGPDDVSAEGNTQASACPADAPTAGLQAAQQLIDGVATGHGGASSVGAQETSAAPPITVRGGRCGALVPVPSDERAGPGVVYGVGGSVASRPG